MEKKRDRSLYSVSVALGKAASEWRRNPNPETVEELQKCSEEYDRVREAFDKKPYLFLVKM